MKKNNNGIPEKVKLNGYTIPVFYNDDENISPSLKGDFNEHHLKITIQKQKNKELEYTTFLHEIFHAIDYLQNNDYQLSEKDTNVLAHTLFQTMQNNNFCLNPENFDDNIDDNDCFYKENDKINPKACNIHFDGMDIPNKIVDPRDNWNSEREYNKYNKILTISKNPSSNIMNSNIIKGFLESVNDVHKLNIDLSVLESMGQSLYQVLSDNQICFKRKK